MKDPEGKLSRYLEALHRVSVDVDVPGTPRSLRLEDAEVVVDGVRLTWSFVDPEVLPGDRRPHGRRIRGELEVPVAHGLPTEVARFWWAEAQLAAARRYTLQIDADWVPGEPYIRRGWTTDQAWEALLTHLGRYGAEVHVEDGEIRVVHEAVETTYRIDPDEWAAFLAGPATAEPSGESEIVPAGIPLVDGLPVWAVDELVEAAGAWGPVVGLVGGQLVGVEADDG